MLAGVTFTRLLAGLIAARPGPGPGPVRPGSGPGLGRRRLSPQPGGGLPTALGGSPPPPGQPGPG